METHRRAQAIMQRGADAYRLGGPDVRRLLTQAFLARIEVDNRRRTGHPGKPMA
jgi:hypothetical protein